MYFSSGYEIKDRSLSQRSMHRKAQPGVTNSIEKETKSFEKATKSFEKVANSFEKLTNSFEKPTNLFEKLTKSIEKHYVKKWLPFYPLSK